MRQPQRKVAKPQEYDWQRGTLLALANHRCAWCAGLGVHLGRWDLNKPCECVLRQIFRTCHRHFVDLTRKDEWISQVTWDRAPQTKKRTYGMKNAEYMADFVLVAKRSLNELELKIFRWHYLLGAEWHQCCPRLNMNKGQFYHHCYRIERKLGRIYTQLRPYPLYPVDEYFNGEMVGHRAVRSPETGPLVVALRPPVVKEDTDESE